MAPNQENTPNLRDQSWGSPHELTQLAHLSKEKEANSQITAPPHTSAQGPFPGWGPEPFRNAQKDSPGLQPP